MRVAIVGLWHLGCVTAACLANFHEVIAYDPNHQLIANLQQGITPVFEPGLDDLISKHKLTFTANPQDLANAEMVWITFDTPVDESDVPDVNFVMQSVESIFPYLQQNTLVIISSQIPVGTTCVLQKKCMAQFPQKNINFAYIPENLRLGHAIELFLHPERIIIGLQNKNDSQRIESLLHYFSQNMIFMSIESAEISKHAINAFLASSVIFINELANICEQVGANAYDVEQALKSEARIGTKAYLHPGAAIAGGTLLRDVNALVKVGQENQIATPYFSALLKSNQAHKEWSCKRILNVLKNLNNKTIATLGLTYKAGTDTLRRSTAIETCVWLHQQGANVRAFDPVVNELPNHLQQCIDLKVTIEDALHGADAIVINTEWPQFSALTADKLLAHTKQAIVFDASGFLMKGLGNDNRIQYYSVGR